MSREFQVHITARGAADRRLAGFLRKHLTAAHAMEKRSALVELSIALVGRRRMAELHERFLGERGPTDVLTFEMDRDDRGRVTSGEVVVCTPVARTIAGARGGPFGRLRAGRGEILLYCLHGMLHLLGYDDRTRRGFDAMHIREDQILTRLGLGALFGARS